MTSQSSPDLTEGNNKSSNRKSGSVEKDVIILHQFPRGKLTPSISPFVMKLETYLRMAGLKYQNDFKNWRGPKGKMPWISLNGKDMGDSQLIMEFLGKKFNKDLSSHLSPSELAVATSMRIMAEEHLFWIGPELWMILYNKVEGMELIQKLPAPYSYTPKWLLAKVQMRRIAAAADYQGLGRHTKEEVIEMGFKDLRALSNFLGDKPFFMGDQPTEVDCALFGQLTCFVWNMPTSPFAKLLNDELTNLRDFAFRMKEKFWPDWDQCLDP